MKFQPIESIFGSEGQISPFSMGNAFERADGRKKAFRAFGLFCVMLLLQRGEATDFTVGGSKGWGIPTDPNAQSYNQWAEGNRFQVRDSIVFNYPADQDSVFQVSQDDYNHCSTESPIKKYSDGHTVFQFDKSGPLYFISGNKDHCLKNEKLVVVVLADRSNSTTNQTATLPPAPSATPEIAPSPAPQSNQTGALAPPPSEMPPSPAPENNQSGFASPPPSEPTEISPSPAPAGEFPTPAPVSEPPPPSAASLTIPGCIGSIGALAAALALDF